MFIYFWMERAAKGSDNSKSKKQGSKIKAKGEPSANIMQNRTLCNPVLKNSPSKPGSHHFDKKMKRDTDLFKHFF